MWPKTWASQRKYNPKSAQKCKILTRNLRRLRKHMTGICSTCQWHNLSYHPLPLSLFRVWSRLALWYQKRWNYMYKMFTTDEWRPPLRVWFRLASGFKKEGETTYIYKMFTTDEWRCRVIAKAHMALPAKNTCNVLVKWSGNVILFFYLSVFFQTKALLYQSIF